MDLKQALQQYHTGVDIEQTKLKQMYDAQQTEIGKAGMRAQKEFAERMKRNGINVNVKEVICIHNAKTGEKRFYMKG